eukprot:TRINITY_DN6226_c0_g1_i1.p1 TRINITY_DN6226_c0_g1~~TRINITY_DN6226_c0_g1_i1.p1  ORF type:complete len:727 (-),score=155.98 TRINITY_DN6226_c0_g1_i1:73-2187(-)
MDSLTWRSRYRTCYVKGENANIEEDKRHELKSVHKQDPVEYLPRVAVKYINAFLNSEGGTIYFGVENDGCVSGVSLDRAERDACRLKLDNSLLVFQPQVDPDMWSMRFVPVVPPTGVQPVPDLFVIEITVRRGKGPIYFTNSQGKHRKAYVRQQASTSEMSESMIADRKAFGRATSLTLTARPKTLIGRDEELARISSFIKSACAHLVVVSLHGLPLVGKSSLAQQVLDDCRKEYPDLHCTVNFTGEKTPYITTSEAMMGVIRLMYPTAAPPRCETELVGLYQACFRGRRCVLFVENVGNAAQVAAVLPMHTAACVVLVTSRKDLLLDASLPSCACLSIRLGPLSLDSASKLLLSLVPSQQVDRATAEQIVKLCYNMPMPILFVASRINRSPLRTSAAEACLQDLRVLARGDSGGSGGRTAEFFFGGMLRPDELPADAAPLVVFPGSFDCTAAGSVLLQEEHEKTQEEYEKTQQTLQSLVDYSFLQYDPISSRYSQCDIVRALLLKHVQTKVPQQLVVWKQRYTRYYAKLLQRMAEIAPTGDLEELLGRLYADQTNLVQALQYAMEFKHDDLVGAMRKSRDALLEAAPRQLRTRVRHLLGESSSESPARLRPRRNGTRPTQRSPICKRGRSASPVHTNLAPALLSPPPRTHSVGRRWLPAEDETLSGSTATPPPAPTPDVSTMEIQTPSFLPINEDEPVEQLKL